MLNPESPKHFLINKRKIRLKDVESELDKIQERDNFEYHSLKTISDWIAGKDFFELTTSGSTGPPKAIQLSRQQLEASARMTCEILGLTTGDKALICINSAFIGGKMMIIRSLLGGLAMTLVEPEADPFQQIPVDDYYDFMAVVPIQLTKLIEEKSSLERLNSFKAIIVGGAQVSQSLLKKIQIVKSPIFATYGMTETASHIALKRLNGLQANTYYNVFPGISIKTDQRNCLVISGPQTGNNEIVTNDIVNIISPQEFEWIGRMDNVINSGGLKIQLELVERMLYDLLEDHNILQPFFVHALEDELLGQKLILLLEGEDSSQIDLLENLKASLGRFTPKEVYWIPNFSRTITGKIKRNATIKENEDIIKKID